MEGLLSILGIVIGIFFYGMVGLVLLGLVLFVIALIQTAIKGDSDLWDKSGRGGPGPGP